MKCGGTSEREFWEYEGEAGSNETHGYPPRRYVEGEPVIRRVTAHREGKPGCGSEVQVRNIPADPETGDYRPMFRRDAPVVLCPVCDAAIEAPAPTDLVD